MTKQTQHQNESSQSTGHEPQTTDTAPVLSAERIQLAAQTRKYKRRANLILLTIFVLFVAVNILRLLMPGQPWWLDLLFFMTEAGLVGGCADWYAVTALFRHPLGIPGKHTAIIPRTRTKLIDAIAGVVERDFLPPQKLKGEARKLNLTQYAIRWVDESFPQPGQLGTVVWSLVGNLLQNVDQDAWAHTLEAKLKTWLLETDITPYLGQGIRALTKLDAFQTLLDQLIDKLEYVVSRSDIKRQIQQLLQTETNRILNRGNTFTKFFKKAAFIYAEDSGALNLSDAAHAVHLDLIRFIHNLHNHDDKVRLLLLAEVEELAARFLTETSTEQDIVNAWKIEAIQKLQLDSLIKSLLAAITASATEPTTNETSPFATTAETTDVATGDAIATQTAALLKRTFVQFIENFYAQFKADEDSKALLEQYIQQFISRVIDQEHHLIAAIATDTMSEFTEERLNSFIEDHVIQDLTRIRINGSLIGAAIGLVIYACLQWLYTPLLTAIMGG
jgi:uncharacterized membrane-anchored protein YjiN (DUF445 family)